MSVKKNKFDSRILNPYNYSPEGCPRYYESHGKPSDTVPDQAMTVDEIVARYTQGIRSPVKTFQPVWYKENDISEFEGQFDHLTVQEKMDLVIEARQTIQLKRFEMQEKVKELRKDEARKAAIEKAAKAEEYREKRVGQITNATDPNNTEIPKAK